MKKFLAALLAVLTVLPFSLMTAFAEEKEEKTQNEFTRAFAEDENSLIVFVTGIGQSFSYLFDEKYTKPGAFPNGTLADFENYAPLIASGEYVTRWNLLNSYFDEALKDGETVKSIARIVFQLLFTLGLRKNMVKEADVRTLLTSLFQYNIPMGRGERNPRIITPRYVMPVSEYPVAPDGTSEAKTRFYNSIPCGDIAREKLGENFEDYLYCYNYNAFSYTSENVQGLRDFIEAILADNKVGAREVVLVPMSMGASVVSAYLNDYPDRAENHVRRVVSIVGCWNGSELVYDLITKRYADNSPDLVYHGLLAEMVGEPWGYVINFLLRFFSKSALRSVIDETLGIFVEELLLTSPSLAALVPPENYEEVRALITNDEVRAETDAYYRAQVTLQERLEALRAQGITFSFLAGYGLPFGAVTSDYQVFGFMASAEKTNSDEIINISSTAPGTAYVPYNESFADPEGRILSPDGSIDISNTYFKDSTWFFRGQKHELEYNNAAISLAFSLALGEIKTVSDCDGDDAYFFPQFNGARNIKALKNDYLPAYEAYVSGGGAVSAAQASVYENVKAMMRSTVLDAERDNALIEEFYGVLVQLGLKSAPGKESGLSRFMNGLLKKGDDVLYRIFGAKGFFDFGG